MSQISSTLVKIKMTHKADGQFELVANIWPIVDGQTGMIQRVAARAYVLPAGEDQQISTVLTGLTATDFNLAKQYPISKRHKLISEHGEMPGTVEVGTFNQFADQIIDPILDDLAENRPDIVGIAMVSGEPRGVSPAIRFAQEPYTVITFLIEDVNGNLIPHLPES